MLLAGDIGGTKTHLALFEGRRCVHEEKFPSGDFSSLSAIIAQFLSAHPQKIQKACLGIAGPVLHGKCQVTNLPWIVETSQLAEQLKTPHVHLINDLEANAWGISALKPGEFLTLNPGAPKKGNRALLSAGTGLGEAGLYWDGKQHYPFATEGGHADFAPRNELEMELFRYLEEEEDHISYETVLSGEGIYRLYRFLVDMRLEKEGIEFQEVALSEKPAHVITEKALNQESAVCVRALDWFLSIYGAEAGNLALKFLAIGGVYIGGGIAAKISPAFKRGGFLKSFSEKGKFRSLLSSIPVHVILNEKTALLGAVEYLLKKEN